MPEDDFLSRLYDLTEMPSHDHRRSNAAGDIRQHRINWNDWPSDWVFTDDRFGLLRCPDEELLRFLCETIHPAVRPDADEARALAAAYNTELDKDGWRLVEIDQISGRPVFAPQQSGQRINVFEEPTGWKKVDRQFQEVRQRLDSADSEEEYQAVGLLCREAMISVAQEVYAPAEHITPDGVTPSATDANRMLEAVFLVELRGAAHDETRAHAKAALKLANALQHKRTADFRMAALCAEATSSVINLVAIIAGRRGRAV